MSARAVVIGGGVGGLAAAITLARAGVEVDLFERARRVGGKLDEVTVGGRVLGAGPSVLTMPAVFDALFAGERARWVTLTPLAPQARHFFTDGSRLDLFSDEDESAAAIARFAGSAAAGGYRAFRRHAARLYALTERPFITQPLPPWHQMLRPRTLAEMAQIDGLRSLWQALGDYFHDPRLRQLFARYATYNGSSPFHAPGTLAVIAHVENAGGTFVCRGGLYRLAEGLEACARALGVRVHLGANVEEVVVAGERQRRRAGGVRVGGERVAADAVIANGEVAELYGQLLPGVDEARGAARRLERRELSLSAYVLYAVAARAPVPLGYHNVFFSADYEREFEELIQQRRPPEDPTVYLCCEDRGPDGDASGGDERCFFLTNAPPLDARGAAVDWEREAERCRARLERVLARHGWRLHVRAAAARTPGDFAARFAGSRGALYGLASNSSWSAFQRPANRARGIAGLYLCGGSAHPGAGVPMAALSGGIAARLCLADLGRT